MNNAEKPHAKNLRKGRVSLPNHAYLVTIVTASRKPVFASFTAARLAVRCFHDKGVVRHAKTLAFVVMPDQCSLVASARRKWKFVRGRPRIQSKGINASPAEDLAAWIS